MIKKRLKVAVLMGGKSPEHEVSILSGTNVVRSLNPKKYEVFPVVVSKTGTWRLTDKRALLSAPDPLTLRGTKKEIVLATEKKIPGPDSFSKGKIDIAFIAMHGPYGEDGRVQGMLETAGIAYTGSGVLASALGMDKVSFRKIMTAHGLPIPKYAVFEKGESLSAVLKTLGRPSYFVKPSSQGSSVGASIVKNKKDLPKAIKLALKHDSRVLIDEYIKGTEVTCAVLGNKKPFTFPVIEIVPLKGEFFNYESKYTESGSLEIVPAKIPAKTAGRVQNLAVEVYKAVGCRGFARVDFILKEGKFPVILEINTIPGLTPVSLIPKAAKAAGISYTRLIDKIIMYANEKK